MIDDVAAKRVLTKFVADLSGDHVDLPEEIDNTDYIVQTYHKTTGVTTSFGHLVREPGRISWYTWVQDPHGYPGAQDPREPPSGHLEPLNVPEGEYRMVVMW